MGLVVTILILCTSNYQLTSVDYSVTDQTEGSQEIPSLSIKSFDILNSSAQIQLNHQFVLVREIEAETDEEINVDLKNQIQYHFSRAFQVLFKLIIAPNAP